MNKLSQETIDRLQKILSKHAGRELSDQELEQAYYALMGFAEALIELSEPEEKVEMPLYPIANNKHETI